jgi:hypothetical protein
MLEDTSGVNMQMLATMPGQNFTTDITSAQFSAFSWYEEAITNTSKLISIIKQDDPFNGGINLVLGYVMGFQTGNLRGVFGVHFNENQIERLVYDLVERASGSSTSTSTTLNQIAYYIYDSAVNLIVSADLVISTDPLETLDFTGSSPSLIDALTANYTNRKL